MEEGINLEKVTILSREKFLEYKPDVLKKQVVSIRIADNIPPVENSVTKYYLDSLSLAFYDYPLYADETDISHGVESLRLTEKDKKIIDEYIDRYSDKHFVLHCEAGKSRSAAIGYYILKRLGYIEELNQKKKGYICQT